MLIKSESRARTHFLSLLLLSRSVISVMHRPFMAMFMQRREQTTTRTLRRPTVPFIQSPIVREEISLVNNERETFASPSLPASYERVNSQEEKTTAESKTSSIDPSTSTSQTSHQIDKTESLCLDVLAAVLAGIAIGIFFVNIIICYMCKRYH